MGESTVNLLDVDSHTARSPHLTKSCQVLELNDVQLMVCQEITCFLYKLLDIADGNEKCGIGGDRRPL